MTRPTTAQLNAAYDQFNFWYDKAKKLDEELAKAERRIAELESIRAAAEKLVRCKGRYHSEQNYRALAALFGVTTPDLPPLEHENVHYADAAEMEIAELRQRIDTQREYYEGVIADGSKRIAELESEVEKWKQESETWEQVAEKQLATAVELESRTVTVKLPEPVGVVGNDHWIGEMNMRSAVIQALKSAGIKWEAE